jgi:hypothetical protein
MSLNRLAIVPSLLATLVAFSVFAQDPPPPNGNGDHPHGPPPEAISACVSKTVGSSCSFTGRRGESLSGTCETHRPHHPQDGQAGASMASTAEVIACRPPRPNRGEKPGDQQGPPPPNG